MVEVSTAVSFALFFEALTAYQQYRQEEQRKQHLVRAIKKDLLSSGNVLICEKTLTVTL